MGRMWHQNACTTRFSRLTLKFTNTMRLQPMLSLKKRLEKIVIASHIFHQDARLQCERQFTPTLRPSHGFLSMWSLPFGEKRKVKASCTTFLLCNPCIETIGHHNKPCVEKKCLNSSPRNSAFETAILPLEKTDQCVPMNETKSFWKCWLWFYTACVIVLKENVGNAFTANSITIPYCLLQWRGVRVGQILTFSSGYFNRKAFSYCCFIARLVGRGGYLKL